MTSARRAHMVRSQIASRGVTDEDVLQAMLRVPREEFVPHGQRAAAYEDNPLPIEEGQTISQPYVVALMAAAAEVGGGDRVLEIGTGSGYAAAVLAEMGAEVYTIERHESLARTAARKLARYPNVTVKCGDGTRGWPEHAPYDAIVVTAGGPEVPRSLREQLAVGGRLVIPVGSTHVQSLMRVRRADTTDFRSEELTDVRFVPLVGEEGWAP